MARWLNALTSLAAHLLWSKHAPDRPGLRNAPFLPASPPIPQIGKAMPRADRYNADMTTKHALFAWAGAAGGIVLLLGGCGVKRTITVTSEPSGALLHLNDREVGRTPATVSFLFYGTYDVRLELEGYKPLWTSQRAKGPWWEAPGLDLAAEVVGAESNIAWHFTLEPLPIEEDVVTADTDVLLQRARELQAMTGGPRAAPDAAAGDADDADAAADDDATDAADDAGDRVPAATADEGGN